MRILPIMTYPKKILTQKAKPIEIIDKNIVELAFNMIYTMYKSGGIGLAAPQVNEGIRLIVIDLEKKAFAPNNVEEVLKHESCKVLVNPEITGFSEEKITTTEGCLSILGFFEDVERSAQIVVKAKLLDDNEIIFKAHGKYAVCLQHEIDHLDGKVYLDRISSLKRNSIKKKLKRRVK